MENQDLDVIPVVSMDDIVAVFGSFSDTLRTKDIKEKVVANFCPADVVLYPYKDDVERQVVRLLKDDSKQGNASYLTYNNGKYKKRRQTPPPTSPQNTTEIGVAGECAVLSELLFHGYNANRMILDEGVDIVAVKNNVYYYVQVKTTTVDNQGRIYQKIPLKRFEQYQDPQIRYIIVARTSVKGVDSNMYFTFTRAQIEQGMYQGWIKRGIDDIIIKIRFNPRNGEPILYDVKESGDMGFLMNKFDLL